MSWYLDSNNKLVHDNLPPAIEGDIFVEPYPASLWALDDNDEIEMGLLPEPIELGAFYNAQNLSVVELPESLLSIGRYSFAGTALTKVIIPNDNCTYYSTSFPPGCMIIGGRLIT